MLFRKRPLVVNAFAFGEEKPSWFIDLCNNGMALVCRAQQCCEVVTVSGIARAFLGDYIVRTDDGGIYVYPKHIFESVYERVEDGN